MGFLSSDKPYTAVTSTIEHLCSRDYDEDDVADMVELMEIINLRPDGPTEAARALRKKLKYGGKHVQLRALVILDTLVENGDRLAMLFNDYQLLDRLKIVISGTEGLHPIDPAVQKKAQAYAKSWSRYKGERGYEGISSLYRGGAGDGFRAGKAKTPASNKKPPRPPRYSNRVEDLSDDSDDSTNGSRREKHGRSRSTDEGRERRRENRSDEPAPQFYSSKTRARESKDEANRDGSDRSPYSSRSRRTASGVDANDVPETPTSSKRASLSKFFKGSSGNSDGSPSKGTPSGLSPSSSAAPVNAKVERPRIRAILADAHGAATNLNNALRLVNTERGQLSTDDEYSTECFNKCRKLRKKVVRYIHVITDDEFVGPLLHANEELIDALRQYDKMASLESSESELEDDWRGVEEVTEQVAQINIPKRAPPPIPKKPKGLRYDDSEEDDNPFGDANEL